MKPPSSLIPPLFTMMLWATHLNDYFLCRGGRQTAPAKWLPRLELGHRMRLLDGMVLTSACDNDVQGRGRSSAKTFATVLAAMRAPRHVGLATLRRLMFHKTVCCATIRALRMRACQVVRRWQHQSRALLHLAPHGWPKGGADPGHVCRLRGPIFS
jgi:hypothetical protein